MPPPPPPVFLLVNLSDIQMNKVLQIYLAFFVRNCCYLKPRSHMRCFQPLAIVLRGNGCYTQSKNNPLQNRKSTKTWKKCEWVYKQTLKSVAQKANWFFGLYFIWSNLYFLLNAFLFTKFLFENYYEWLLWWLMKWDGSMYQRLLSLWAQIYVLLLVLLLADSATLHSDTHST